MATYRDEREAALAQSEALRRQNEGLQRENDGLRRDNDALRVAAGLPRQERPRSSPMVLVIVAAMLVLMGAGAAMFVWMRSTAPSPPPSVPQETPPAT
jgi:hypothetical protein